jgi:hypothetical protein
MSSWRNKASTRGEVNSVACCIVLAGMLLNGRAEALDAAAPAAASIEQAGESGSVKVSPRDDPTSESNAVQAASNRKPFLGDSSQAVVEHARTADFLAFAAPSTHSGC